MTATIEPHDYNIRKKVLIAFFSHSGNTRQIARQLQTATGGDLFEIEPVEPFPTVKDAAKEVHKWLCDLNLVK
jgi:flavodoxin